tara:strand:- start:33 stop:320 length:288 start_codon:yes stop_codon:yes gene_type:complete
MSEEVKFTKQELDSINNYQGRYAQVRNEFGDISLSRINLNNQLNELDKLKDEAQKSLEKIQSDERAFLDELNKKYGEGNLNPETGVFTPIKTEKK